MKLNLAERLLVGDPARGLVQLFAGIAKSTERGFCSLQKLNASPTDTSG